MTNHGMRTTPSASLFAGVVWKFPLMWAEANMDMPTSARIIHVGMDPGSDQIALWAIVEPGNEVETRRFAIVATGATLHDPERGGSHVGSVIDGNYVWHVFETPPKVGFSGVTPEIGKPSPHKLYAQAGGDVEKYRALMIEHGHLVPKEPS